MYPALGPMEIANIVTHKWYRMRSNIINDHDYQYPKTNKQNTIKKKVVFDFVSNIPSMYHNNFVWVEQNSKLKN